MHVLSLHRARVIWLLACSGPTPRPGAEAGDNAGEILVDGDLILGEQITCEDPSLRETEGPLYAPDLGDTWNDQPYDSGERRDSPGLVVADITGDGRYEIFLTNKSASWVFRLKDDGSMSDLSDEILPDRNEHNLWGGSAADYDGDGDIDVFAQAVGLKNRLYRNDGGWFTDATRTSVFEELVYASKGSAWGDMDLDGDLDLVVSNETSTADEEFYDPPDDGPPNQVYENLGDGSFELREDILSREASVSYTFLTAWLDLDADLDPDLYSVNAFGHIMYGNRLLENRIEDGELLFEDISGESSAFLDMDGMGLGIGDLNGDEYIDMLVTDWGRLWLLESAGPMSWYDTTAVRGLTLPKEDDRIVAWGAELVDLDNDTDLDLVVMFGESIRGARREHPENPEEQPDGLWLQNDDGVFELVADDWAFSDQLGAGRGFAPVDLNDDGYLDIVKRMAYEPATLHLSRCGTDNWLRVRLAHPAPNTHAIGAKVRVVVDGESQIRWIVAGGTSLGYGGPNEAHFGLGEHETVDRLDVIWPDGTVTRHADVDANQKVWVARDGVRTVVGMPD